MKRFLDVVVGSMLFVLALPITVAALIVSIIFLRSNPFFVQARVGYMGRRFKLVKIRTLPVRTPVYADKYQLKMHRLPRPLRMIRKAHLDELPQLVHVVIGRMSLVGPRPEMPNLHASFDPAFAELRTSVRPGCFGLWQVSPERHRLIGEAPAYDAFYVNHRTIRLDLWTVWQGVIVSLQLRDGVSITDIPGRLVSHRRISGSKTDTLLEVAPARARA